MYKVDAIDYDKKNHVPKPSKAPVAPPQKS